MNAPKSSGYPCDRATANELSQNNVTTWRIIRAVKQVAAWKGLQGDAFGDTFGNVRRLGTMNQELLVVEICVDTPKWLKKFNPDLVRQVARNIVMTDEAGDE